MLDLVYSYLNNYIKESLEMNKIFITCSLEVQKRSGGPSPHHSYIAKRYVNIYEATNVYFMGRYVTIPQIRAKLVFGALF